MYLHALRILLFLLLMFISSAFAADENPYSKSFSLTIAYQNEGEGSFLVTLKNISDKKLDLFLNAKELEGTFLVSDGKDKEASFLDKDYQNGQLIGPGFPRSVKLDPDVEIKWTVKLDELVYNSAGDRAVTKESIKGQTISLRLDRLDVVPVVGESSVRVKISSNAVKIP